MLILNDSYSQEINFNWNKIFGNTGNTSGLAIQSDTSGNIYASGSFEGSINYNGTIINSTGGKDGFLLKLDSAGDLIWSKHFSSNNDVNINSLAIDKNNNLILLGDYKVKVDFDLSLITNNTDTFYSSNMFVCKYSSNGNLLWAKNTGGRSFSGNSLTVDLNNDIIITGKSVDINYFDTLTAVTTLDSFIVTTPLGSHWEYYHPEMNFIAKYDTGGNKIWIKKSGGNSHKVISDNGNNIIITGNFSGNTYFDSALVSGIGTETSFLAHYSPNGDLHWVKTSGGSANWNCGYGLAIDTANNIYQSGQILGNNIEFGGNIILPFAGIDAYLSKYDINGNLIWHHLIGTPTTMEGKHNANCGKALKTDNNGDIFLLGYFMDTLICGIDTLKSNGAYDLMLLKYNSNGTILTSGQYTDYGFIEGVDLSIGVNREIYLTGLTTKNFWGSIYPSYAFIGKVDNTIPTTPVGLNAIRNQDLMSIYPNPSNGLFNLNFGVAKSLKKINIYSIDGKRIQEFTTNNASISFVIKDRGVYFVSVQFNDELGFCKVIVE